MEEKKQKCCAGDGEIVIDESMTPVIASAASTQDMAELFKALGDERRLTIVKMIAKEPGICACTILQTLNVAQPTLSHHMRILTGCGIVDGYRQGKWMHYTLSANGVKAIRTFADSLLAKGA